MNRFAAILLILGSLAVLVTSKIGNLDISPKGDGSKGSSRVSENDNLNSEQECPAGMHFTDKPHLCEFTCTDKGVNISCKSLDQPGCVCPFEKYYNTETKACSYVDCKNLDCVGRQNEAFYHCESGSRESCLCSNFITLDCRTGCQCKNGFCREGDKCVARKCKGSPFS
ncbi:unnamed protein product [Chironomus riparius]|uniref:Uncharacterized protein n=1 Tax=Chironomus riparius TaxID=315576 RepID=A0A9N9S5S0_9DIPT|nr:unnamed protein product [Chironomus riparius]